MPNISKITLPDGVTYDLVAASSDTKVTQNNTNADEAYRVLLSKSANNITETNEVNKNANLFYNPSKQALTVGSRMVSTTIGTNSTSIGSGNEASGTNSLAEGNNTTASGNYSHAEGYNTTASVGATHAEGSYTTASGSCSHAEGNGTTASGDYSHAEGNNTTSSGSNSHAQGSYTTAQRKSQHVFGEYNVLDTGGTNTTTRGDYVEIVGNGAGISARSNARTLDWSGNEWIAGNYKSDALTASKILVSDANKNIVSSSYEFDVSTNNTSDTWLLVMNNGKIQHRVSTDLSVANASALAGQNSNLTYSTPAQWGTWSGNGFRTAWYDTASKISNQPSQYGFLLHVGRNYGEGHQIWCTQANGDLYHRGFNASSTLSSVAFKKILDSSNGVQSYADNTFYRVTALITFKSSNNALVAGDKGNYIWGISSWSDSRLKKNIKDSQVNALDIINKIKMHKFDFKDEKYGHHEEIGYVADELREIIPECVVDIPISEEEQKKYKTDTLMQVEDKHLIKYLIKAIQELSAEVERLKGGLKDEK